MLLDLQACQDRKDLAVLLGVPPKELAFTLYVIPDQAKYSSFCISKKNGGTRHILAPIPRLKWLQKRLLEVLYECENDISASLENPPNLHFGFRRGINIFENANRHRKRRFVLNIDIADYFDQFNFGRVRGFFIHDNSYKLAPAVATTIAQIACFDNKLPQGSPCSPHIANLATRFFDIRMTRFLRGRRCRYTRYADDITISTDMLAFPNEVAVPAAHVAQGWEVAAPLKDIFARAQLPINFSKVRMSAYASRQSVTGLVVNDRPNVAREYYLTTRAMCQNLFKNGKIDIPDICTGYGKNCGEEANDKAEPNPLNVLEGRLSHIHYLRERTDNRSIQEKQDNPTQFWTLFQNFYMYKYFVGNARPVILTEGPSDIFYIKAAVSKSAPPVPELKEVVNGESKARYQFFKFGGVASNILGLTGGTGNIKRFLYLYNDRISVYNNALRAQPVVILIDNDSGGNDVISMVNGIFKTSITVGDPQMIHRIRKNLFLVKTNHIATKQQTCVEDMLPAAVTGVTLNGKTFSSAKKIDTVKHFGKVALAHYVQANASSIDLTGLDPILRALNDAIATALAEAP